MGTTCPPVVTELGSQLPLGMYATTPDCASIILSELVGLQAVGDSVGGGGGGGFCTLKLSVFESERLKFRTMGLLDEMLAPFSATNHALYSLPWFGVAANGASSTVVEPLAGL